jgi:uncharacterized protein (DUF2141 family)
MKRQASALWPKAHAAPQARTLTIATNDIRQKQADISSRERMPHEAMWRTRASSFKSPMKLIHIKDTF